MHGLAEIGEQLDLLDLLSVAPAAKPDDRGHAPDPHECSHATQNIRFGEQVKTMCSRLNLWTNCQHVGHCLA